MDIVHLIGSSPWLVYATVFGMLLACGLGLPLPEDITLVAAGYAVHLASEEGLGHPALIPMILVGLVGVLSGDTILFMLGRWLGPRVTRVWPFRLMLSRRRMKRVSFFFHRHGTWTAFLARFVAGLRAPTYLVAGAARMAFRRFILADSLAAFASVPLLVISSYLAGAHIDRLKRRLGQGKYVVGAIILVVIAVFIYRSIRARRLARPSTSQAAIEDLPLQKPHNNCQA